MKLKDPTPIYIVQGNQTFSTSRNEAPYRVNNSACVPAYHFIGSIDDLLRCPLLAPSADTQNRLSKLFSIVHLKLNPCAVMNIHARYDYNALDRIYLALHGLCQGRRTFVIEAIILRNGIIAPFEIWGDSKKFDGAFVPISIIPSMTDKKSIVVKLRHVDNL